MKTVCSLLLFTTLAIVCMPPARGQDVTGRPGRYRAALRQVFPAQAGGRLAVERVTGSVVVRARDAGRVEVEEVVVMDVDTKAEAERMLADVRANYEQTDDGVRVRGTRRHSRYVAHAYTVLVPLTFSVDVDTGGGAVTVEGVRGTVHVSTAGGAVTLSGIVGDVDVRTAGGPVRLENIDGTVEAGSAGGDLHLAGATGRVDLSTAGGEVYVARARRDVVVSTAGGDIEMTEIGGTLRARTAGGDLTITGVRGAADLSTSGGDIRLRAMQARVAASTNGGDVTGRDLAGPLTLETSAGSILLHDVRGPVEATSAVGDIEVELTLQDVRRPHEMHLRTRYGDIRLTIPASLPAHVVAEISRQGRWDDNDIYCDCALSRQTPEEDRGRLRSEGDLNGGGDLIDLHTRGGSIYIRTHRD